MCVDCVFWDLSGPQERWGREEVGGGGGRRGKGGLDGPTEDQRKISEV